MRTALILLVLCAFASFASATSLRKSHLHSNSTLEHKALTGNNFAATCRSITISRSLLSAQCQDATGVYVATSTLNLNTCFSNTNGWFTCGTNYILTAAIEGYRLSGTTLYAKLKTADGYNSRSVSVDLNNNVSNINGNLQCDCRLVSR